MHNLSTQIVQFHNHPDMTLDILNFRDESGLRQNMWKSNQDYYKIITSKTNFSETSLGMAEKYTKLGFNYICYAYIIVFS